MEPTPSRSGCARWSRDRDEPLLGTASQVRRWVLVEQPGPWGRDALAQSRLPADVAAALLARCQAVGARPLLVRRFGRRRAGRQRSCYLVSSVQRRIQRVGFGDPRALADLDLAPLAADEPVAGAEPVDGPLFLTCTHGRHDACCAELGRPVAAALATGWGERAWESSHLGGDRFAANLLCLPDGVYYGRVEPQDAAAVADRHARGLVTLDLYRGRSVHPFAVQAAETLVRRRLGIERLDAVRVTDFDAPAAGRIEVSLTADGHRWTVVVEVARDETVLPLTCGGSTGRPPRYALAELRRDTPLAG